MIQDLDLLEKNSLLKTLSLHELESLVEDGHFLSREYREDTVLHLGGERCEELEIILSGEVIIERIDESGQLLTLATLTPQQVLGGNLLFSSEPNYPMTISTTMPTTLLEIKREMVLELCQTRPLFLERFLEILSDTTTILRDKITKHFKKTIRDSIVDFLKVERERQKTHTIKLTMTKKMLAERLGVQRTSLSRELKKMRDKGMILYDAFSITILDIDSQKR